MSEKNKMSRVQKNKKGKPGPNKKKNKKADKSLFKKILLFGALIFGLLFISGIGLFSFYASTAPELTEKELLGTFSSELLDDQGDSFYILGSENRDFVNSEEIPDVLKEAVVSIEDQRFYTHKGVDPIRLAGAVLANVKKGFGSEGGSTITQQLVKLSVFSTKEADQTLKRKAQEAWLAVQLERQLSKDQILTLYINKVYMSDNVYGMGTASEYYFNKSISDLDLHEAALFAGMPQSPNSYNPYSNPERAKKRRDRVLLMMVDHGVLTQEKADVAQEIPISEGLADRSGEEQNNLVFDAYLKQVLKEVRDKTGLDPYTAGLTIQTNLNMDAQQRMYDILNSDDYVNFPDDRIQAGVSMVDVESGEVKALGGGRKQEVQLGTNRATELDRSIGSTMKPLSVYGPAIEYQKYSTYEQVVDEPHKYQGSDQTVRNYDGKHKGQMSIREALVDSRNVSAVKTLEDVGLEDSKEFLEKVGITKPNKDEGLVWSNALGGNVTPMQLSSSYAAFGNGGTYTDPYTVSKVVTANGQDIDLKPTSSQAMSEATAYMVTDILKDVAGAYNSSVGISGVTQAGKTGTTNYSDDDRKKHAIPSDGVPDSWYSGYTTNYSISVWVGYDKQFAENSSLSTQSGTRQLPRDIYQRLMTYASENIENTDWSRPSSVVEVAVEKGSDPAMLPGSNTPSGAIVSELFIKGTEPTEESNQYGEKLLAPTGLTAEYDSDNDELEIEWDDYEFTNDNQNENIVYLIKVNEATYTSTDNQYTLASPPTGSVTISVSVQAFGTTGPDATVTLQIEEPEEEEEEDEEDEEEDDTTSGDGPPEEDEEEEEKQQEQEDEEQQEEEEEEQQDQNGEDQDQDDN